MIQGVTVRLFEDIITNEGAVQHMLRSDDQEFTAFGEIYFSITNPGVIKCWHLQKAQTNVFSCIHGKILLVLYDTRESSPTKGNIQEMEFGDGNRRLVKIPPGVAYGWKNIHTSPSMLANCASHPHDPAKATKLLRAEVPYAWP